MARRKTETLNKNITVTLRMPKELHLRIKKAAAYRGITASLVVQNAVLKSLRGTKVKAA